MLRGTAQKALIPIGLFMCLLLKRVVCLYNGLFIILIASAGNTVYDVDVRGRRLTEDRSIILLSTVLTIRASNSAWRLCLQNRYRADGR